MGLRIAVVGTGRWGKNILRTLSAMPDISVRAVTKGETAFDADAAIIATPSETHAAVALPYIERGIPVFIEKPMTTSVEDAERIRAAAKHAGSIVFVGHIHLFNPAFRKAKEILCELGPVRSILSESANDRQHAGASLLWEWLPHDLSLARDLFGTDARSTDASCQSAEGAPGAAIAEFVFGDATLVSRMDSSPRKRRRMVIEGTDATLVFDDVAERKLAVHHGSEAAYPPYDPMPPLEAELRAFIASVRTGTRMGPDAEDGLAIVRMIAAAEEAAQARLKMKAR